MEHLTPCQAVSNGTKNIRNVIMMLYNTCRCEEETVMDGKYVYAVISRTINSIIILDRCGSYSSIINSLRPKRKNVKIQPNSMHTDTPCKLKTFE